MADQNTAVKNYMTAKQIKLSDVFKNPFSSVQEFQAQVGVPVEATVTGIKKLGNWIEQSKFGKWANESNPYVLAAEQKAKEQPEVVPSAEERMYMPNAGGAPLTEAEIQHAVAERQQAAMNAQKQEQAAAQAAAEAVTNPAKEQPVVRRANPGLFSGALQSYNARRNWVKEHLNYLREKGANIDWANYRGTAEQNLALKRLLGGYDAWNAAQQATVQPAQPVQPVQPTVSPAERFVKEGYQKGEWQDEELRNMDGDHAIYLNKDDYGRWLSLQSGIRRARPFEVPVEPVKPTIDFTKVGLQPANPTVVIPTHGVESPVSVQPSVQARPITVEEARLQKAQQLAKSNDPIDQAMSRMYFARNGQKHKLGGKINYQKVFK